MRERERRGATNRSSHHQARYLTALHNAEPSLKVKVLTQTLRSKLMCRDPTQINKNLGMIAGDHRYLQTIDVGSRKVHSDPSSKDLNNFCVLIMYGFDIHEVG